MTIQNENVTSPVESTPDPESPISAARLAANQANARHSTGPKSDFTKNISAQNPTIHGLARHQNGTFKLLSSEDPAAFEELKQSLATEHSPLTTTEAILINGMAESNWLAARAQRLQDTCINLETGAITNVKLFSLYMRYQTTHSRSFHKWTWSREDVDVPVLESHIVLSGFCPRREFYFANTLKMRFLFSKLASFCNLAHKSYQYFLLGSSSI